MDDPKPASPAREWWIYPQGDLTSTAYAKPNISAHVNLVHVIEISALHAAEATVSQLRIYLAQAYEEHTAALAEVERLKAECPKYHEADMKAIARLVSEVNRYKLALESQKHSLGKLKNGSMFTPEAELDLAIKNVNEALKGGGE